MGLAGRHRVVENFQLDKMGDSLIELLNKARSLSKYRSPDLANSDLVSLFTQHATAIMRARDEVRKAQASYDQLNKECTELELAYTMLKFNPPIPSAPARTYFCF